MSGKLKNSCTVFKDFNIIVVVLTFWINSQTVVQHNKKHKWKVLISS